MGSERCLRCIPLSHWDADRCAGCAGRGKMPSGTWGYLPPGLAVSLRSDLWGLASRALCQPCDPHSLFLMSAASWSTGTAPPVPCVPCLRPSAQHSSSLPQVLGAPALRCTAATRQQEQAYRRHLSCCPSPAILSQVPPGFLPSLPFLFPSQHTAAISHRPVSRLSHSPSVRPRSCIIEPPTNPAIVLQPVESESFS
jgi:hypothetical protein